MVEIYQAGIHEPKGLELVDLQGKKKLIDVSEVLNAIRNQKIYVVNPKASKVTVYQANKKVNAQLIAGNSKLSCVTKKIKDSDQYVLVGASK